MVEYVLPILYALFVWWFSTGVIMYLDGLPAHTFRWTMFGGTAMLALAIYGLHASAADTSVTGAYVAFTSGLLVFGWTELSFYTGFITGPRKTPGPEGCSALRRFWNGVETTLHHEIALIAAAVMVVALAWGDPNKIGVWTFVALWWMHESAKLNVFFGVPNLNEEFLPDHMRYLGAFFRRKPMNLLFPISVTVSTAVTALIVAAALDSGLSPSEQAGLAFLGTLMALAVLEHWLLVVPLPAAALWNWSLLAREPKTSPALARLPTTIGRRP